MHDSEIVENISNDIQTMKRGYKFEKKRLYKLFTSQTTTENSLISNLSKEQIRRGTYLDSYCPGGNDKSQFHNTTQKKEIVRSCKVPSQNTMEERCGANSYRKMNAKSEIKYMKDSGDFSQQDDKPQQQSETRRNQKLIRSVTKMPNSRSRGSLLDGNTQQNPRNLGGLKKYKSDFGTQKIDLMKKDLMKNWEASNDSFQEQNPKDIEDKKKLFDKYDVKESDICEKMTLFTTVENAKKTTQILDLNKISLEGF